MGISNKKTTSTQNTSQNTNMTMTPTNPEFVTRGIEGAAGRINDTFANLNPYDLVAGADPLQTQAAQAAAGLGRFPSYGGGGGQMSMSSPNAYGGGQASGGQGFGPTAESEAAWRAANPEKYQGGQMALAMLGIGGDPARAATPGAAGARSSGDPYADAMSTFNGLRGAVANTYDPTTGQAVTGEAATGQAVTGQAVTGRAATGRAASLLTGLDAYMSPYTKDVVDTSLADFDYQAGQDRAQSALDMADGAFSGSRSAIASDMLGDSIRRGRASLSAGLRDQGFTRGAALSADDANRRQAMTLANMGARNAFGLANMDAQNSFGRANMDAQNTYGLANLGAENAMRGRNMDALNTYGLANMDALNQGGQFNAGQRDAAEARRMAGAAGLASTASEMQGQQRANVTTQAQMGEMLRQIEAARRMAPVGALGLEAELWNTLPLDLFRGQNATGTMTGTTKGTTKESGAALGDWLNYFASNARAAASMGGG